MTASLRINKKDNKYYVHLNWKEDGKRKQKCIGTGLSASGNNKRRAQKMRDSILREWEGKISQKTTNITFADFLEQWIEMVGF